MGGRLKRNCHERAVRLLKGVPTGWCRLERRGGPVGEPEGVVEFTPPRVGRRA